MSQSNDRKCFDIAQLKKDAEVIEDSYSFSDKSIQYSKVIHVQNSNAGPFIRYCTVACTTVMVLIHKTGLKCSEMALKMALNGYSNRIMYAFKADKSFSFLNKL